MSVFHAARGAGSTAVQVWDQFVKPDDDRMPMVSPGAGGGSGSGISIGCHTLWQARNESQHSSELHESENRDRIQSLSKALGWFETMANHPFPPPSSQACLEANLSPVGKTSN